MVTEIVELNAKPGREEQFQNAIARAKSLLTEADGCHGLELRRCMEAPQRFLLMVRWETVEHHTEKFVGTADWKVLLGTISPFLADEPKVQHFETVM